MSLLLMDSRVDRRNVSRILPNSLVSFSLQQLAQFLQVTFSPEIAKLLFACNPHPTQSKLVVQHKLSENLVLSQILVFYTCRASS